MTDEELQQLNIENELLMLLDRARAGELTGLVIALDQKDKWVVREVEGRNGSQQFATAVNIIKRSLFQKSPYLRVVPAPRNL